MITIIAGGPDRYITAEGYAAIEALKPTEIVSGGAIGIDLSGEVFAKNFGLPVKVFQAEWDKHGKNAGPIRNGLMADYADMLIAFPGGKGTRNMMFQARNKGLAIIDWTKSEEGFLWKFF